MRVTNRTLQDHWVQNIQNRLGSLDQLNRQIGTGVRVQKPADDPVGAGRMVRLGEAVARNEQYLRNISETLVVHRTTESALDQAYQHLVRVKSVAVEGASDVSAAAGTSFAAMADEVRGIQAGLLQIARIRHEDRYLFSGTAGAVEPFGPEGGAYRGDSNRLWVNAGNGQTVAVNLPGDLAFRELDARSAAPLGDPVILAADLVFGASDGSVRAAVTVPAGTYTPRELAAAVDAQLGAAGANLTARIEADGTFSLAIADSVAGGEITVDDPSGELSARLGVGAGTRNVFALLDDLATALDAGDAGAVGGMLDRLDRAMDSLLGQRGLLGARSRNLELARDRVEAHNATNETLRAEIEGVDLPKAVMRVSAEEQAYQTALAAGSRIFNVSIIDFLR